MLSRRALSEGEIRLRLSAKGYADAQADDALGRLRELGLVDDRVLCSNLALSYRDVRLLGPRRIAGALLMRRFPRDLVEEALRAAERPEGELAAASAALGKKFPGGVPGGREGAAKAYRFLSRRGFSPDTCRRAIRGPSFDIEEEEG